MKNLLSIVLCLVFAGTVFARDKITIVGSSTVYPFTTVVAEKHGKKGWKTPIVESTGTGGGMRIGNGNNSTNNIDLNKVFFSHNTAGYKGGGIFGSGMHNVNLTNCNWICRVKKSFTDIRIPM